MRTPLTPPTREPSQSRKPRLSKEGKVVPRPALAADTGLQGTRRSQRSLPSIEPTVDEGPSTRRGVAFMLVSLACFTGNILLLKFISTRHPVDVPLALALRAVIGVVLVLGFFNGRRPVLIRPAFAEPTMILRGLLGLLGTAAFYWVVPALGAGRATLLTSTYILFAALFAALFLGEKMSAQRAAWLVLAFTGVGLITSPETARGEGFVVSLDAGIALFAAVTSAVVVILIRVLGRRHSNGTIYFAQCLWIGLPALPLALWHFEWHGWSSLVILSVAGLAAGYGQLALSEGFRCLNVATGASIQMLLPLTASLGGYLLFDERLGTLQLAGAAVTLLGTWQVAVKR